MIDKHQELFKRAEESDLNLEPWEREVVGMFRAIEIVDRKARGDLTHGFTKDDVLAIHRAVLNDPFNPQFSGVLRRVPVKLGFIIKGEFKDQNFVPVGPHELPQKFEEFSKELEEKTVGINGATPVGAVIETASWAYYKILEIHPFIEGNGRTARLMADLIFKRANLPFITDWGSENDEYKEVVDASFKTGEISLIGRHLAKKLLKSLEDLESEGLSEEVAPLKLEIEHYLNGQK